MARICKAILNLWLTLCFLWMLVIFFSLSTKKKVMLSDETMRLPSCSSRGMVKIHLFILIFLMIITLLVMMASCCKLTRLQIYVTTVLSIGSGISLCMVVFEAIAIPREDWYHTWLEMDQKHKPWTQVYSPLLQLTVVNSVAWSQVEHCLETYRLCDVFHNNHTITESMFLGDAFLIENCCWPPSRCHFEAVENGRGEIRFVAEEGAGRGGENDKECLDWMKTSNGKCYSCGMCKASYLAGFNLTFNENSNFRGFFAIFVCITLLIVTCGAFEEPQKRHGYARFT